MVQKSEAMRISYRTVSGPVLLTLVLSWAIASVGLGSSGSNLAETGTVHFNPCQMWEQIPLMVRTSSLALLIAIPIILFKGLLNRPASRWLAIGCLLALGPVARHEYWWFEHCYNTAGKISLLLVMVSIGVLCTHQIFHRRAAMKKAAPASRLKTTGGLKPPSICESGRAGA